MRGGNSTQTERKGEGKKDGRRGGGEEERGGRRVGARKKVREIRERWRDIEMKE